MATVSHLPHVVANALAAEAAAELTPRLRADARGRPELPRHDPRRRLQPGDLGRHLRQQPRGGRRRGRRRSRARLREAAELIRSGDREARRRLARRAPARTAAACSRPSSTAGRCASCASSSPTGRARSPSWRWRWARPGVNIEDMALYPAPDMTSGAVSLWVAGDEQAERAAALVRELGHTVTVLDATASRVAAMTRFDPAGPAARLACARPPTSRSPTARR